MSATLIYTHDDCMAHHMQAGHPERPERLRAVMARLHESGLADTAQVITAPLADDTDLSRVHTPAHLKLLQQLERRLRDAPPGSLAAIDPDTAMMDTTFAAARRAAGAVVDAVQRVVDGRARRAFCAVRPPGHHAEVNAAMGFCFLNSVAIGARAALAAGLERVAICDFDVHHGNGTVDAFRNDTRVMVCSSFQHPFYPNRGLDADAENIIYSPLQAGCRSDEFRRTIDAGWVTPLQRFAPQLVILSAGFDAHRDDPLAGLNLTEADFAWVTRVCRELADDHAGGRVVAALEGGYDLDALAASSEAHVAELFDGA